MLKTSLNSRMRQYYGSGIGGGVESHDTTTPTQVNYESSPNETILDEIESEIAGYDLITNQDTALKLLSDSNEALRRLDIIRMNVNYPVSGYRTSVSTIMKADPGLESSVGFNDYSKRRLNVAIESISSKVLVGIIAAVIAAISGLIFKAIARMRKKNSAEKPPTAEEIAAAKLARSKSDEEKIQRYFDVNWHNYHKHSQATVADVKATEARIEMIMKLGDGLEKEILILQREAEILDKAAYDGDYSQLDELIKPEQVDQSFYILANKLEDAMDGLMMPAVKLTREEFIANVTYMASNLKNFNTLKFERAGSRVARFKNSLELLRKHLDDLKVNTDSEDTVKHKDLQLLQKKTKEVAGRAMDLAMAYKAANAQDFAINQAYSFFATYLRHIEKVTGNKTDDDNSETPA